ncbi:hypothetical protein BVG16_19530 [Paenibacillus selenitireducens]|uniref:Copper amine oxidase-like N-terminal domain-containing protein n=1 Tax=Paenibacillus selenitireducens TaxID=1324314 RepID=A0A1T2X7I8_9BACL|nr:hypothetical protein BVG16_19530 [Paenibacillus selenitireducens]
MLLRQRTWKTWIAAGAALWLSIGSVVGSAAAAQEQPNTAATRSSAAFNMVSLGDSLTVGFEPQLLNEKNPLPYGFMDRVLEQALYQGRAHLSNYGILGLTSEGLRNYVKAVSTDQAFRYQDLKSVAEDPRASMIESSAAQAKQDIINADVITITIGGNDFGALLARIGAASETEGNTIVQELLKQYTANVTEVLQDLTKLNGDAQIVIADQYQPMPNFQKGVYNRLMAAADQFTKNVDELAKSMVDQGAKVKVAHVAEQFKGKEGELTHTNLMEQDIHPTQKGYEVMAKVFANTIWGTYRQPKVVVDRGPATIVVNGQELNTKNLPVIRDNRTFVAIKDIVDALGATSQWDNKTSTAIITYGDRVLTLPIGAKSAQVNGQTLAVDAPAFLYKVGKEQKTYVPLRLLADGLGFQIENRTKAHTVFINP